MPATLALEAVARPDEALLTVAARLDPWNAFHAPAYVRARARADGVEPLLLALRDDGGLVAACPAFLRRGRLGRVLEIDSLPPLPSDPRPFWDGLRCQCRALRVNRLEVNSYASAPAPIPALGPEAERRARAEHVLDLGPSGIERGANAIGGSLARNLAKARKAGVEAREEFDPSALEAHVRLLGASFQRRRERGESGLPSIEEDARRFQPYLETAASLLYQARWGGVVVSSLLVLIAERGACNQSIGTSPEGMRVGASSFLIDTVARVLGERGWRRLNLGGAGTSAEEAGLWAFKASFGGRVVEGLEAASFDFSGPLRRGLRSIARRMRSARVS